MIAFTRGLAWSAPKVFIILFLRFPVFPGLIYESIWSHYLKLFLGMPSTRSRWSCLFLWGEWRYDPRYGEKPDSRRGKCRSLSMTPNTAGRGFLY